MYFLLWGRCTVFMVINLYIVSVNKNVKYMSLPLSHCGSCLILLIKQIHVYYVFFFFFYYQQSLFPRLKTSLSIVVPIVYQGCLIDEIDIKYLNLLSLCYIKSERILYKSYIKLIILIIIHTYKNGYS